MKLKTYKNEMHNANGHLASAHNFTNINTLEACIGSGLNMLWHLTQFAILIGWLSIYLIYTFYMLSHVSIISIVTSPFFKQRYHLTLSMACDWYVWVLNLQPPELHLYTWWDSDWLTMVLAFNNDHIIYYHMVALWSVGLSQIYFAHPDYMVVQCQVCTTYLSPDTVKHTGPPTFHDVNFFMGRVNYTLLGTLCNFIMAIIDHSKATMSFVGTAYDLSSLTNATMSQNVRF